MTSTRRWGLAIWRAVRWFAPLHCIGMAVGIGLALILGKIEPELGAVVQSLVSFHTEMLCVFFMLLILAGKCSREFWELRPKAADSMEKADA